MHRLTGDTQGVSNLLPRPALFSGRRNLVRLDSLSQAMERQRSAKPNYRVIRREVRAEVFDVHDCQYRLTISACQSKLTKRITTPECPRDTLARPAAPEGENLDEGSPRDTPEDDKNLEVTRTFKEVETKGIEPSTSGLQSPRSTN